MRKIISVITILATVASIVYGANVIVNPHDVTSGTPANRNITITLTGPSGQAVSGPWIFSGDSVVQNTGTNGSVTFSNLLALGQYRLDISGNPPRSFPFSLSVTSGTFNVVSLLGTNNSVPVFYDSGQVDALITTAEQFATNYVNLTVTNAAEGVIALSNNYNGTFAGAVTTATNAFYATNFVGKLSSTNLPTGIDTSNYVGAFTGNLVGNASTATSATSAGTATSATGAKYATNFVGLLSTTNLPSNIGQLPFMVIQLPDEQYQTNCPGVFSNTISYIIAGAASNNLKLVISAGDCVNTATFDDEYITLTNQLWRLTAAGIPFFTSAGNHDNNAVAWEKYMTPLLLAQPGVSDTYSAGQTFHGYVMTNTFSGIDFAWICVDYNAYLEPTVLSWATSMQQKYANRVVEFVIHGYMNYAGNLQTPTDAYYLGGDTVWTNTLSTWGNLAQVFCGHISASDSLGNVPANGVGDFLHHISVGASGNVVNEFMCDFQWSVPYLGQVSYFGGNWCGADWLGIYSYQPGANQVVATSYENVGKTNFNSFTTAIHSTLPNAAALNYFSGAITSTAPVNIRAPLDRNLIFYLPFEEAGGGQLNDYSPYRQSAVMLDGPTNWLSPSQAYAGKSSFLFETNYWVFSNPAPFNTITNNLSISWLWYLRSTPPVGNSEMDIIGRHNGGVDGQFFCALNKGGSSVRCGLINNSNVRVEVVSGVGITVDGLWHQSGITWDGVTLKLFVDGVLINSAAQSGPINTNGVWLTSGTAVGFFTPNSGLNSAFSPTDLAVDELKVWNRTLSDYEMQQLASSSTAALGSAAALTAQTVTNAGIASASAATNALGSAAFLSAQVFTNESLLIGAGATNNDTLLSLAATNQSLKIGLNGTNNDTLMAAGITNGLGLVLSNYVLSASQAATNESLRQAIALTNGGLTQVSNYSLIIAQNGTNEALRQATLITNGLGAALSNYVSTVSGGSVTPGGNNAFTGLNTFAGATTKFNTLTVTNGLTNLTATANTAQYADANGKLTSLANGGANTTLHGTSPPSYTADVEADLSLTDITTANASTTKHGFMPKGDANANHFFNGNNAQTTIPDGALSANVPLDSAANPFTGLNTFAVLSRMDSLSVTNGLTNGFLTAQQLVYADVNKRLQSIPAGGSSQYLKQGTPPAFGTIQGSEVSGNVGGANVANTSLALSSGAVGTNNVIWGDGNKTNGIYLTKLGLVESNNLGTVTISGGQMTNSGSITVGNYGGINSLNGPLQLGGNPSMDNSIVPGIGGYPFVFVQGNFTATTPATVQNVFEINPTITQGGSAGFAALAVDLNEISLGSGPADAVQLREGGTVRVNIDRSGNQTNGGVIKASSFYGALHGNADTASSVATATSATAASGLFLNGVSTNQIAYVRDNGFFGVSLQRNGLNLLTIATNGQMAFYNSYGNNVLNYNGYPASSDTWTLSLDASRVLQGDHTSTRLYDTADTARLTVNTTGAAVNGTLGVSSSLTYQVLTSAKTVNYTVSAIESGTYYNNNGAVAAVTNTLPAAVVGLHYSMAVVVAQNMAFKCNGSDHIQSAATASVPGGLIYSSTLGSALHLYCPVAGVWYVDSVNGTFTVQ